MKNNDSEKRVSRFASVAMSVSLVATLLSASIAHASCGETERVSLENAGCLTATWTNPTFGTITSVLGGSQSEYTLTNACRDWGKVVAVVKFTDSTTTTQSLTTSLPVQYTSTKQVDEIECCSDLSDLCNKSDVLSAWSCWNQFENHSEATNSCENLAVAGFAVSDENCDFTARCEGPVTGNYQNLTIFNSNAVSVWWPNVSELNNCSGTLTIGEC